MTLALAKKFGCSEVELANIRRGALLHDVGKLGIPDAILLKPGSLTDEEWVIMRNHPVYAYEWLSPIEFLRNALDIPYCHHEKWDGTGYPRKLAGEAIPLSARMFAAVDICDALRSDRPYRKGWPIEKVRSRISSLAGTHLDPRVVEVFLPMLGEESLPSMLDSRVPTVETAEEFVVLLDEKWRIQSASRGFLAAFLPSQDPRGVDFLSLIDSPSRERCRRLDKSTGSLELVHLTPSKSRREVTYSISNQAHPSGNLLLTAVGRSRSRPLEFLPVTPAVDRELLESRRLLSDRATASRRGLGFPVPRP
jgi:hypothetical protein